MILTGRRALRARRPAWRADDVRVLLLAAEAAARDRLHHAQLLLGQAEGCLERLHDVVRALQRAERHERAVGLEPGGGSVRLDVGLLLVRHAVLALDRDEGARQPAVDGAAFDVEALEHGLGPLGVEHRRFFLVLDADVSERGVGLRADRVRDEQDRLLRMADAVLCEQRLVVLDQRDVVGPGDVVGRHDHVLAPGERRIEGERADPAAGDRRAQRRAEQAAGKRVVVHVLRGAAELVGSLGTARAAADDLRHRRHSR